MLMPWWQMEILLVSLILDLVLRCLTEPHPRCVEDGTCLHFYLGMVVSSYVESFFDGSEEGLVLSSQYTEIINGNSVTRHVDMVMYGEGAFRCSLNLSPNIKYLCAYTKYWAWPIHSK